MRHGTKKREDLTKDQKVYVRDKGATGHVIKPHSCPRSYIIETENGSILRRNAFH